MFPRSKLTRQLNKKQKLGRGLRKIALLIVAWDLANKQAPRLLLGASVQGPNT